jgi:O-succinylbenzoate synthase
VALLTVPFEIPMRLRFRRIDIRRGVVIKGPGGWGEFSPFPEYPTDVAARWLLSALEAATGSWPDPVRTMIPINVTVPAVDGDSARRIVETSGCSTAKVKVAEGDDLERVAAVRDALGPGGKLRVDANGAWDVETARKHIKELDRYDLEYVEQPVPSLQEMAQLRKLVDVPLAADESVRTAEDPLKVAGLEAADIVVTKVQPLGGVRRALEVAEAAGLPTVVSSALETSIGIAAGIALAAALPELPYACGLGTVALLERDLVAEPLLPLDGYIPVRRPEIDEALLAACAPDEDVAAEWNARLAAAAHAAGMTL